jgi:Holliday junction resolvase RusA-like endonuclease
MTRRDRWAKRPCVLRYFKYKDLVRAHGIKVPVMGTQIIFYMPMPKSWTKTKKKRMQGTPHQQTPDVDNLIKAILDALYGNDSVVWDIRGTKYWANEGQIDICYSKAAGVVSFNPGR